MIFSGISDEAGRDIETQIKAHRELGWDHLELRLIGDMNLTAIPDAAFDEIYEKVTAAGMTVSCFGSAIANWARPITCDPQIDLDDLKTAIKRMQRFGTKFIRVMSYPNHKDHPLPEKEWRNEVFRRMKNMAKMAEDAGIILAHENCSGWGGLSAENSNILLGEVDSPALKVLFDTGNPVTYHQDPWQYYQNVYKDIVYVHIKDAKTVNGEEIYTYCGEGSGCVKNIVGDLLKRGYNGVFSIEPHLAAIIHTGQKAGTAEQLYNSYVEYGRRLIKLVEEVKP